MLRVTSHGDCGTTSSDSSTYFHRQAYVTNQLTPNPKQGLADSYTLTYSFILSVRHLIARTRTPSIAHSYTPSLTLYFSHKLAHSLTLSLTHTHAHTPSFPPSLTHSLTHSLSGNVLGNVGAQALVALIQRAVGEMQAVKISFVSCDCTQQDPSLFDASDPGGKYKVQMNPFSSTVL